MVKVNDRYYLVHVLGYENTDKGRVSVVKPLRYVGLEFNSLKNPNLMNMFWSRRYLDRVNGPILPRNLSLGNVPFGLGEVAYARQIGKVSGSIGMREEHSLNALRLQPVHIPPIFYPIPESMCNPDLSDLGKFPTWFISIKISFRRRNCKFLGV